jgi:hypothetical protein
MKKIKVRLGAVLLLIACSLHPRSAEAAPRKRSATQPKPQTPISVTETTRLRAKQPAVIYISRAGTTRLEHLHVEVMNVGLAPAYGIEVTAEWGGGVLYAVKGSKRLGPGRKALYTLGSRRLILGSGPPRIIVRCANCSRY